MSFSLNIQSLLKTSFSEYTYLRASSLEEVDAKLPREHIGNKPIIIHYNLPEITVSQGVSNLEETYPLQILFAYQSDIDQDPDELDNIIDECKTIADKFWDLLLFDETTFQQIVQAEQGDNLYTLTPFQALQMGGELLAGVEFKSDITIHRSTQTTS